MPGIPPPNQQPPDNEPPHKEVPGAGPPRDSSHDNASREEATREGPVAASDGDGKGNDAAGGTAQFRNERPGDKLAAIARTRNRNDLAIAVACTPAPDDDVEDHCALLGGRLGAGKGQTMKYCDIGIMLRRMPRFREDAETRGHVPMYTLMIIAGATESVADEHIGAVEAHLLEVFTPAKTDQALPGPFSVRNGLRRLIAEIEPEVTPPDDEESMHPRTAGEDLSIRTEGCGGNGDFGSLHAQLTRDRMAEFEAALTAVRDGVIRGGDECSWADALMHMARGTVRPRLVINIYRDVAGGPAWLDGAGWLDRVATEEWCDRATHMRLSGDSRIGGYVPGEAQKARVRGRDGTCRFPGCEVPAHKCDIDHIEPYDHENPGRGGPTDTRNLHCLCRRHHNLKTAGLWDVTKHADDSETWTSRDRSETLASVPTGPMSGLGRQTFDQRATRTAETLRAFNRKKLRDAADFGDMERRRKSAQDIADHERARENYRRAREAHPRKLREHAEYMEALRLAEDEGLPQPEEADARSLRLHKGWAPFTPGPVLLNPPASHRGRRKHRSTAEQPPRAPQPPPPIPGIPF